MPRAKKAQANTGKNPVALRESPRRKASSTQSNSQDKSSQAKKSSAKSTSKSRTPSQSDKHKQVVTTPHGSGLLGAINQENKVEKEKDSSVMEADILAAKTPAQLADLVKRLVSTEQDEIFERFRETARQQQSLNLQIMDDLKQQLETKQQTIDSLAAQIQRLQSTDSSSLLNNDYSRTPQKTRPQDMYESPIRNPSTSSSMIHQTELADELKTISFTFDMLELLTGVRIINYEDDKEKFYFDVKQSSTLIDEETDSVCIEYRLVIKRKFESTAEVTYIPTFLNNLTKKAKDAEQEVKNSDAAKVMKHLPDYLQDNLKFPYNTLSQFYTKLSKALNKSTRS